MTDFTRRLMYRPHPKGRIDNSSKHESWPFLIEIQGTKNRCDWGQLVGEVWAHSGDYPDTIEAPEYYARLFAASPRMLAALQAVVEDPSEEAIRKAKDAIADATMRSSCPACNGDTEKMPCETCSSTGMISDNLLYRFPF